MPPPSTFPTSLRDRVTAKAENRPGVYRFTGPRGEVLYVGKSIRVRTRLLSYFRGEKGSREAELLRSAAGVEWEYVPNEFEALLRELRLIRSFRPRFNVRHRRERRFAWIRLSAHPAPRLVATRAPRADGSRYFGPFPAGRDLPETLRDLALEVGLRDCPDTTPIHFADQMDLLAPPRTPGCIRAELGSCPAPCAGGCSEGEYRERVRRAAAFLSGGSDELLDGMRRRLAGLSDHREYEHAARLRDRIARLELLRERVGEFERYLERLDFVYAVPGPRGGRTRRYLIRRGRVRLTLSSTGERLAARIERVLGEPDPGPTALSPGEREELFFVVRWFRQHPKELGRTVPVEEFLRTLGGGVSPRPGPSAAPPRTPPSAPAGRRGASA
jgi:excinuclease ABC subunit C